MTDAVQICLIGAVASVAPSIIALIGQERSRRNADHLEKLAHQVNQIETATNSMKDALVTATGKAEFARGLKTGTDAARGPQGEAGPEGPRGEEGARGKQGVHA